MLIVISTLVLVVIAIGLFFRHRPKVHIPCMLGAFCLDLGLVLYIELTRHALATVGEAIQKPIPQALLIFHVVVSLLVLILYLCQLRLGLGLLKQPDAQHKRILHRNLGISFVVLRLTNYITSLFVTGA
ncbi:MAG TPA: hypothetical protein V6C99_03235 [Oculatellaceae cyanobacterium]|jgi:uncharacterized membrane protein YozB (DUF420 family)